MNRVKTGSSSCRYMKNSGSISCCQILSKSSSLPSGSKREYPNFIRCFFTFPPNAGHSLVKSQSCWSNDSRLRLTLPPRLSNERWRSSLSLCLNILNGTPSLQARMLDWWPNILNRILKLRSSKMQRQRSFSTQKTFLTSQCFSSSNNAILFFLARERFSGNLIMEKLLRKIACR